MIWFIITVAIILLFIKSFFDVKFDFRKEYGVIWYTCDGRRDGLVLWGTKY